MKNIYSFCQYLPYRQYLFFKVTAPGLPVESPDHPVTTETLTHSGVVKFGFELTVEDNNGNKVGTLQLAEPSRTKFANGGDVIYKSSRFMSEYVPIPALVSIVPDSAAQGEMVTTVITATNSKFTEQEPVIFLNNNENPFETLSASSINVINDVTVEATFNIPSDATPGFWDLNADEMILDKSFTVTIISGFADNGMDLIKIYPNPASQRFFVENVNGATLGIYTTGGDMLTRISIMNDKQEVNVGQLSKGFYLVKIELNGITKVEKLLVN
jgi:hypothetical protein